MDREKILFLANYPDQEDLKDGMYQRIYAVDQHFNKMHRHYVHVTYRRFLKMQKLEVDEFLTVYRCNIIVHFFFLLNIIGKSSCIYFHSVYCVLNSLPFLFLKGEKAKMVLDVHGIVPEEEKLKKRLLFEILSSVAEKYIMKYAHTAIVVTYAMQKHLEAKYPQATCKYIVYSILPHHLVSDNFIVDDSTLIGTNLSVLYSGNIQEWQNIDLMLDVIQSKNSDGIDYTILTGEPEKMNQLLEHKGLTERNNIELLSVPPEALKSYYGIANYGFILRDDIAVNRVACPTKLVEYLYYGIIPVVKSAEIGDFNTMGYEYVPYNQFNSTLPKRKSVHNQQIVQQLLKQNSEVRLSDLFA